MADAVHMHNGGFPPDNHKVGGSWKDGYQPTGYFLDWLAIKGPDFLRKLNRSTLEIVPLGSDKTIKHVLGKQYDVGPLWNEYQEYLKSS